MTFQQWWASYQPSSKKTFTVTIAHAAYDAATSDMNARVKALAAKWIAEYDEGPLFADDLLIAFGIKEP
jgi:hypothetical protein